MASFEQKYEVQKGRTILCLMGTAHEGEKGITMSSFSGPNNDKKQEMVDGFVKDGTLKKVPLTDDEKAAILKAQEIIKAQEKKRAEAREAAEKLEAQRLRDEEAKAERLKKEAEALALKEAEEAEALALKEKKEAEEADLLAAEKLEVKNAAILEADFDDMNKDPMIQFAKDNEIELKGTLVDDIRAELKALQESLTAPE